eukprot:467914_1
MIKKSNRFKLTAMTEQKKDDPSDVLTKLYRLAYESIGSDKKDIHAEYVNIQQEYKNTQYFKNDNKDIPKSTKDLLKKIKTSLNLSVDNNNNKKKEESKEPKVLLYEYCKKDDIDSAILLLLNYKLNHKNKICQDIVNYIHDASAGWDTYKETAIHYILERFSKNTNKKEEEMTNKYKKRLLLFEIFIREKTSTKLKYVSGGWMAPVRNDSVFQTALNMNNMNVLSIIFKYGMDVDINMQLTDNNSSNKSSSYKHYNSIHSAALANNYELTQLLIECGANMNKYVTKFYQHDYGQPQETQRTLLYLIGKNNDLKMLTFLFKIGNKNKQKLNVNAINFEIIYENKPDKEYQAEIDTVKQRLKAHGDNTNYDSDEDNYSAPWNQRRGSYYIEQRVYLYHYETLMHVAVRNGNIKMIKLSLIYGADLGINQIKSQKRAAFQSRYSSRGYGDKEQERSIEIRDFYDAFMNRYDNNEKNLKQYEFVQDIFVTLEKAKISDDEKNKIRKLLKSGDIYFPEMLDAYPSNMGQLLKVVTIMGKECPIEIINIIIKYFYSV